MKFIARVLLSFIPVVGFADEKDDCSNPITTNDLDYCKGLEVKQAEKVMENYLKASIERNKEDAETVKLIKESQTEWHRYREKHCDSIYQIWIQGTIRGVMYGVCKLRLTKSRVYEIWVSYLTHMDSAPPILPEPEK